MNHGDHPGHRGSLGAYCGFFPLTYVVSDRRVLQVHQIQSGQVIIDLCSVAKELVENSLDAGATTIGRCSLTYAQASISGINRVLFFSEVRFKNNGLDLVEVQDNGSGISPENYENVGELRVFTLGIF